MTSRKLSEDPYFAAGSGERDWMLDAPLVPNTAEEVHRVRLLVCGAARDADDARVILTALGVL